MRGILVNWIFQVAEDYLNQENRYEVAFLAIMITDKFLEHKRSFVKKQNYQLLGTTAFNLGVKFEAGFEMTCSECSNYCDKQFGEKEVSKHEFFFCYLYELIFLIFFIKVYFYGTENP